MEQTPGRIHYLDFMRGFAVILMVMGHSIDSVLTPEERTTAIFRIHDVVRGFTAPLFLFVSGYAFSVATEKRWESFLTWSPPLARRLGKILLLLIVGYALHLPFFSLHKLLYETTPAGYTQLFQVDVLQCVAISLLLLHLIILVAKTPRVSALAILGVAATMLLVTPVVSSIDFTAIISPVLAPYFNQQQPSVFPLFPYAAYLFAGAVSGHFFLAARRANTERAFFRKLVGFGVALILAAIAFNQVSASLYPPHDFWKTNPTVLVSRIGIILAAVAGFYALRGIPDVFGKQLAALGQSSLSVYVLHLVIVYGSAANNGLMQIVGPTLDYQAALAVAATMLVAMTLFVWVWDFVQKRHNVHARFVQAALAGTLLFYFFITPY